MKTFDRKGMQTKNKKKRRENKENVATKKWTKIDKNVICHNSQKFARHIGFFLYTQTHIYIYRIIGVCVSVLGCFTNNNNIKYKKSHKRNKSRSDA